MNLLVFVTLSSLLIIDVVSGKCEEIGSQRPYPGDCKQFQVCVDSVWASYQCDVGTVFDAKLGECRSGTCEDVSSGNGCAISGEMRQNPMNCNQFQTCVHGSWVTRNCPVGLIFDESLMTCNWGDCPQPSATTKRPITSTLPPTTTQVPTTTEPTTVEDRSCQEYSRPRVKPDDCSVMQTCLDGQWVDKPCREGYIYAFIYGRCMEGSCAEENQCEQGSSRPSPSGDCRKYELCWVNVWLTRRCSASNMVYNEKAGYCIVGTACGNTDQTEPTTVIPGVVTEETPEVETPSTETMPNTTTSHTEVPTVAPELSSTMPTSEESSVAPEVDTQYPPIIISRRPTTWTTEKNENTTEATEPVTQNTGTTPGTATGTTPEMVTEATEIATTETTEPVTGETGCEIETTETATEGTEIVTEATYAETEATEPVTEASEPQTEATEPHTEATEPQTDATEPRTEATEPQTEATEPQTEATEPVTEASEPQTEATEPVPETTNTATETTESATDAGGCATETTEFPTESRTDETEIVTEATRPETEATEPETEATKPVTEATKPVTVATAEPDVSGCPNPRRLDIVFVTDHSYKVNERAVRLMLHLQDYIVKELSDADSESVRVRLVTPDDAGAKTLLDIHDEANPPRSQRFRLRMHVPPPVDHVTRRHAGSRGGKKRIEIPTLPRVRRPIFRSEPGSRGGKKRKNDKLHLSLESAHKLLRSGDDTGKGAASVVVIFTPGKTDYNDLSVAAADKLKREGVEIMVVGIRNRNKDAATIASSSGPSIALVKHERDVYSYDWAAQIKTLACSRV